MIAKIALIQMSCSTNKSDNISKAGQLITEAADKGAKIICLPELFSTLYFSQHLNSEFFELAETIPGPTIEKMSRLAKEKGILLIVPIFEEEGTRIYYIIIRRSF